MAKEEIIKYISEEKQRGISHEAIKTALVSAGWPENDVDEGLEAVVKREQEESKQSEDLEKPVKPTPEKEAGTKKPRSFFMKLLPFIIIAVLLIGGAAAYFLLFSSSCPKLTAIPLDEWNPILVGHSLENKGGLADTINLNAYTDQSGTFLLGNRWETYLQSQNLGKYELVHEANRKTSECWTGDINMDQDPNYNYCVARIKKKGTDEEKTLWAVFERTGLTSKEISFSLYSKFKSVEWAVANLAFVKSYCGAADIYRSAEQASQFSEEIDLFNPGSMHHEQEVMPEEIIITLVNGFGERISIVNIKTDTCNEISPEDGAINDKGSKTFTLMDCTNGEVGDNFAGNITIMYSKIGSDLSYEFSGEISAIILEPKEDGQLEAAKRLPALPNPCDDCVGVVHGFGGPASMAWTGADYGIAWKYESSGKSKLFFTKIDPDGKKTTPEIKVTEIKGASNMPYIAWTGSGYGILWIVGGRPYLVMTDANGNLVSEVDIKTESGLYRGGSQPNVESGTIVWADTGYGVTWGDSSAKTYFMMLDEKGKKIGNASEVGLVSSQIPYIAWEGSEYGIAFAENTGSGRDIYLARFDSEGERMGTIKIFEKDYAFCDDLSLSWGNSNYGIGYTCLQDNRLVDKDHTDVFFMRIHSTGGRTEMVELDFGMIRMSDTETFSRNPFSILSSDTYAMIWEDGRDGNSEIYFNRIDDYTGTKKESEVRITTSNAQSLDPYVIRTDTEYGMIWRENMGEQSDIFFVKPDVIYAKLDAMSEVNESSG
ncbi:hypothetical protein ACFL6I_16265 [candidate division KSB1 bacterium]